MTGRGQALLRFGYLLTGDRHLSEDLVQDALAKAHRRWERISSLDHPDAYIRRIIVNGFMSWHRRAILVAYVAEVPEPAPPAPRGGDHGAQHADRDAMWRVLATLPKQQRAVLVLRFYEGLADEEIAHLVHCSAATVRAHASKGLARLRTSDTTLSIQRSKLMPSVEDELTQVLRHHAETVPLNHSLLTTVKARSRRSTITHRIALTAAVAAAVTAAAVLPSVAADLGIHQRQSQQQAGAPSQFLVAAPPFTSTFPLTATYLPPGLQAPPLMSAEPGIMNASYQTVQANQAGITAIGINVAILHTKVLPPRNPALDPSSQQSISVTVRGHPATFVQDKKPAANGPGDVTWQFRPGEWVSVSGMNGYGSRETVLRVAEGLVDKAVTPASYFTVELAPRGFVVAQWSDVGLTLGPSDGKPDAFGDPRAIRIQVDRANKVVDGLGKPVTVGNHSGWLQANGNGGFGLTLKISATTRLTIATPWGVPWDEDEFMRFAVGISYTGGTPRDNGEPGISGSPSPGNN